MRNHKRGFTLIELIIAIAILIILTGLLAPQFIKYIERSRRAACLHAMDTLAGEFTPGMIDTERLPEAGAAKAVLNQIMGQHDGHEDLEISSLVYVYSGICKSGGRYRCTFINNLSNLKIECSEHGEWEWDVVTLQRILETVQLKSSYPGAKYNTIAEYFNKNAKSPLNSEADATGGYGDNRSFAYYVGLELTKQGLNVERKSWTLARANNGKYMLYLTEKKITKADNGQSVACTKYDTSTDEIVRGTAPIVMKGSYPIIDITKFD